MFGSLKLQSYIPFKNAVTQKKTRNRTFIYLIKVFVLFLPICQLLSVYNAFKRTCLITFSKLFINLIELKKIEMEGVFYQFSC